MKIKEMFKKVEGFNDLAELMNASKAHIWFAYKIGGTSIREGAAFTDYAEFRKYIRKEYFPDVSEFILNDDGWQINGEREFINCHGRAMEFELYIEQE